MPYREVTMIEIKEVLRLWLAGAAKKRISEQLGIDRKTVRRYIGAAQRRGLVAAEGEQALTDAFVVDLMLELRVLPASVREIELPVGVPSSGAARAAGGRSWQDERGQFRPK